MMINSRGLPVLAKTIKKEYCLTLGIRCEDNKIVTEEKRCQCEHCREWRKERETSPTEKIQVVGSD